MRQILCLFVGIIMLGLFSSEVYAQEYVEEDEASLLKEVSESSLLGICFEYDEDDEEFVKAFNGFCLDLIERKREAIAEKKVVFWWHRLATRVSFVMSHIFVLIALAAAMSEFLQARRLREEGRVAESAEIKVGIEGVAVKTSLFGVVLLITALGFYFLYLKFVYPIQFI